MSRRREGWEHQLAECIDAGQQLPFCWGTHDCATFVANCLLAMSGSDFAAEFRGRYKTEKGAARAIRKKYGSLPAYLDTIFERVSVTFARRGDIVFYQSAVGMCYGSTSFFAGLHGGLAAVPTLSCETAWRF